MNTPVSFEIAKLLKEKGCELNHEYMVFTSVETEKYPEGELFLKPTIAEVVMWLYEKHGIWIYADSHEFGKWCYNYKYNRPHVLNPKVTENGQFGLNDYNSPTEAYEAAIEYILINYLKNDKR